MLIVLTRPFTDTEEEQEEDGLAATSVAAEPQDKVTSTMSFDILDLVSPPQPPPSAAPRDIICYPITNITRPLNLFGEFPKSKAFIPPTPPMRDSSISNFYYNDMLLMTTTDEVDKEKARNGAVVLDKRAPLVTSRSTTKDQKNLVNSSSKLIGSRSVKAAIQCKRNTRTLSEPRRSTPSPVAFGRSISKERTFAEEKKKLEQSSPQCKKAVNLTTRILKRGEFKSSEDLRKAIHKTVQGKKEAPVRMTENQYMVTYQKRGDNHKWTSYKCQKDKDKKVCSSKIDCKQITRNDSMSSLARTNSTYSIESSSNKSCEPIKCKFFGTRQIVKLGAFVTGKKVVPEKVAKEKVKSSRSGLKHTPAKCHPVTTYLSNKKPVSNSKFTLVDRNRSVSPVRSPKSVTYSKQWQVQEEAHSLLIGRSKSQPPKMVELQNPDEPTVIYLKPDRVVHSLETYHSLPRMSRQRNSTMRHVRQFSGLCSRAKSEGPLLEHPAEDALSDRWSVSTPTLNVFDKHADVCSVRNTDRFLELNQLYSHLERVGYLQKVTSQSDLRPIRKKEEVIDYDLWKKIRWREKAQKELDFLINQLKSNQREKRFHFERDVDNIRWKGDNEPALKHKSMSVENLKEYFTEKGLLAEKLMPGETPVVKPLTVPKAIDAYETHLGQTISPTLMSTLSVDQVLKLKTQLRQIYSSESAASSSLAEEERSKRSKSQDPKASGRMEMSAIAQGLRRDTKFHTIGKTNLSEEDRKNLKQSIFKEIKEAVEHRHRLKTLDSNMCRTNEPAPPPQSVVDELQPKDIKGKITFFETKPLEVPGTTIYHARDTSSDEEATAVSMPPQVHRPVVLLEQQQQLTRRSHSFSDLKDLFGERNNRSNDCRSVSPAVVVDAARKTMVANAATESKTELDHKQQPSPLNPHSVAECATNSDQKPPSIAIDHPRGEVVKIDQDVSWMAHKYESFAIHPNSPTVSAGTSVRGRCRKRRTITGSPILKHDAAGHDVLMPHIDIISKTAALHNNPGNNRLGIPARVVKKTGEVEKIKTYFENKHKSSLLGEMFTSEPDISKLRDVSVYLSGSWVAHQYPKKEDNFLSLPRVIDPEKKKKRPLKVKPHEHWRSLSVSPSRKLGILKQCIFPYKLFDDGKLAAFPLNERVFPAAAGDRNVVTTSSSSAEITAEKRAGSGEKVSRQHKNWKDINEG